MAKTFDDKKIIYTMDRVSRSYGTKVVLKDISISYYYGAKIGVVGPNGSGKSSLFKILAGKDTDFTGETHLLEGYTIGYLEQEPELEPGKTVLEVVKEGVKPIQVLRAAFPAGTVSGAPKISAMQILSRLESTKRKFYAGAVGYIQSNGDLDFCITIRSTLKQGDVYTLQAGGGIVYDSEAEREFTETSEKLGALIDTLTK